MSVFRFIFATVLASALLPNAHSAPLLVDSFESGDMSATNQDGFTWLSNNKTSVVNDEAMVYQNGDTNVSKLVGKDWSAIDGDHSLRFLYPAGAHWSEQRFDLGKAYKNLWFQYWVRVPTNYFHGQESPNNHKLFAIWMDGYGSKGSGSTVIWEFWGSRDGSSSLAYHFIEGTIGTASTHLGSRPFITVPDDRGRWMEITIHLKASSQGTSPDGVIQLWRRWEGQSVDERVRMHNEQNAVLPIPPSGPSGWKSGYFMGWANSTYSNDTEWLIDHISTSSESLLHSNGLDIASPPNSPTLNIQN